jgi:hypothetical protein
MMVLEEPKPTGYILGLDLGQARDYSALTVSLMSVGRGASAGLAPVKRIAHDVFDLKRWPLGTPYPDIVADVGGIIQQLPMRPAASPFQALPDAPKLFVDATGCGRPVIDAMRAAGLRPFAVTISSGSDVNIVAWNEARVPKRVLATTLQLALEDGRLRIADDLEHAPVLVKEMENFHAKPGLSSDTFEAWRVSVHDDLVLATAICIWGAENPVSKPTLHLG